MTRWEKHWNSYPLTVDETDHLRQVGKTVGGEPISGFQFRHIVSEISERLQLHRDDIVLDLCCGNGLITREVAKIAQRVVAVDFSRPLISVARKYHQPENVRYLHMSVLDLTSQAVNAPQPFTKAYMYEALQHFQRPDLARILKTVLTLSTDGVVILLGSVPDKSRRWAFYDTPRRKLDFVWRTLRGREAIGTWWDRGLIQRVCESMGLSCVFLAQHQALHTSHYRFDVLLQRKVVPA